MYAYFVWSPLASVGKVPAAYLAATAARGRVEVVGLDAGTFNGSAFPNALTGFNILCGAVELVVVAVRAPLTIRSDHNNKYNNNVSMW